MANSLLAPSAIIGLMGVNPRRQNSLLPFPVQADALDELMFQRAPNGYVETPQGTYFAADRQAAPVQPQAPVAPQRRRVSGLRVLDRVLGGQTITEGLDAERDRLTREAMMPQMMAMQQENERIARALGPQALLALRSNPEALGESLGYGYRPQVIGQGGIQSVAATGQRVSAPQFDEFGNEYRLNDPLTQTSTVIGTRGPSYAEQAQIARVQQDAAQADARLGLDYQRLGQDQQQFEQRLGFDMSKQEARPLSASDQKAIDEGEVNLTRLGSSIGRARQIQQQIQNGELNLGPLTNTISGARNAIGRSNPNSLNYDALLAWAKAARNAALSANTGVQTDQDAIRELDTILSGVKDENVVLAALDRYIDLQGQTSQAIQRNIQRRMGGRGGSGQNIPLPPPGFVLD